MVHGIGILVGGRVISCMSDDQAVTLVVILC